MTGGGISVAPALLARLAPDEKVLAHHRVDPASIDQWERFFLWLFLWLMVLCAIVLAIFAGPPTLAFLVVPLVGLPAVWLWIRFVFRIARQKAGGYEAVLTDRRILWAAGAETALKPGMVARHSGNAVRVYDGVRKVRLVFPADGPALASAINAVIAERARQIAGKME